jgi:flavin reductase (DIM6/NTAB) family NADH-FMN oxidoreductase RutF
MKSITSGQLSGMEKYYRINLINGLVGYKSLNLLGTVNENGITNLCIISSAFHLGANPALIGLIIRPERAHNDTLANIKATKHYTLNNVLPDWYMQAHQTSASYPSGVSEFDTCGFKPQFMDGFAAPFVEESSVRIGLELREMIPVELNGTTIVIGEIVQILADDSIITEDGTIDHVEAATMTVAGLDTYFLPQRVGRLAYAKPDKAPEKLTTE